MTAPVALDVLAVLRRDAELALSWNGRAKAESQAAFKESQEAMAAVAELITLGREVEQADHNGTTTDELMDRFRAALARCGGAQ